MPTETIMVIRSSSSLSRWSHGLPLRDQRQELSSELRNAAQGTVASTRYVRAITETRGDMRPAQNLILHIRNNRRGQSRACIHIPSSLLSTLPPPRHRPCDGCIVCSQCDNGWTLDSAETRGHTGHVDNTNICSGSPNIDPR